MGTPLRRAVVCGGGSTRGTEEDVTHQNEPRRGAITLLWRAVVCSAGGARGTEEEVTHQSKPIRGIGRGAPAKQFLAFCSIYGSIYLKQHRCKPQ